MSCCDGLVVMAWEANCRSYLRVRSLAATHLLTSLNLHASSLAPYSTWFPVTERIGRLKEKTIAGVWRKATVANAEQHAARRVEMGEKNKNIRPFQSVSGPNVSSACQNRENTNKKRQKETKRSNEKRTRRRGRIERRVLTVFHHMHVRIVRKRCNMGTGRKSGRNGVSTKAAYRTSTEERSHRWCLQRQMVQDQTQTSSWSTWQTKSPKTRSPPPPPLNKCQPDLAIIEDRFSTLADLAIIEGRFSTLGALRRQRIFHS